MHLLLTIGDDALGDPLGSEAVAQYVQFGDNVLAALGDGLLGCDGPIGSDAQFEASEQRMRDFVGGEVDVGVLVQALGEEVAERVVFLVEGEDSGVGDACGCAHG